MKVKPTVDLYHKGMTSFKRAKDTERNFNLHKHQYRVANICGVGQGRNNLYICLVG